MKWFPKSGGGEGMYRIARAPEGKHMTVAGAGKGGQRQGTT